MTPYYTILVRVGQLGSGVLIGSIRPISKSLQQYFNVYLCTAITYTDMCKVWIITIVVVVVLLATHASPCLGESSENPAQHRHKQQARTSVVSRLLRRRLNSNKQVDAVDNIDFETEPGSKTGVFLQRRTRFFKKVKKFVKKTVDKGKDLAKKVVDKGKDLAKKAVDKGKDLAKSAVKAVADPKKLLNKVKDKAKSVVGKVKNVASMVKRGVKWAGGKVKQAITDPKQFAKDTVKTLKNHVKSIKLKDLAMFGPAALVTPRKVREFVKENPLKAAAMAGAVVVTAGAAAPAIAGIAGAGAAGAAAGAGAAAAGAATAATATSTAATVAAVAMKADKVLDLADSVATASRAIQSHDATKKAAARAGEALQAAPMQALAAQPTAPAHAQVAPLVPPATTPQVQPLPLPQVQAQAPVHVPQKHVHHPPVQARAHVPAAPAVAPAIAPQVQQHHVKPVAAAAAAAAVGGPKTNLQYFEQAQAQLQAQAQARAQHVGLNGNGHMPQLAANPHVKPAPAAAPLTGIKCYNACIYAGKCGNARQCPKFCRQKCGM
jgi:hypothetical protein